MNSKAVGQKKIDEMVTNYEKFLVFNKSLLGGRQKQYIFQNGYGASLFRCPCVFCGENGLWTMALTDRTRSVIYDESEFRYVRNAVSIEVANNLLEYIKNKSRHQ